MSKFYVTTPIYYVNAEPHIGHAYTAFAADVLARWHRLKGDEVFFLTGTDENASKNVEAAEKAGKPVADYVREMSARWASTLDSLGVSHDRFIRTTDSDHVRGVLDFIEKVKAGGDIYKGKYVGWYCTGCEAFVTESDLALGKCPIHQKPPKKIEEENYFFKLSKYKKQLLDHIANHPDFIKPVIRRNEIVSYITHHLEDISISRQGRRWGITFPGDDEQTVYVWFDALVNYITGGKWWPADLHIVGKDIIKFHCALWPAMLSSAGLPLPTQVFAHGFFTIDGKKISKSLGNAVDPVELAQAIGLDGLRYFLLREIPFGNDGDFSLERLKLRYQSDLANGLGNLVQRVLAMIEKYCDGKIPERADGSAAPTWQSYELKLADCSFDGALTDVWNLLKTLDGLIDREQPWVLAKTDPERLRRVLYTLAESIRHVAVLLWPFLTETSEKILDSLGVLDESRKKPYDKLKSWGLLAPGTRIKKGPPLFPRLT